MCKGANKIVSSGVRWIESTNSENIARLQSLFKTNRCGRLDSNVDTMLYCSISSIKSVFILHSTAAFAAFHYKKRHIIKEYRPSCELSWNCEGKFKKKCGKTLFSFVVCKAAKGFLN